MAVEGGSCSVAVYDTVMGARGCVAMETEGPGPVEMFKARKNEAECRGIRDCSVRDSAAKVRFMAWLTERMGMEEGDRGDMSE